jgi:hypothetical protein
MRSLQITVYRLHKTAEGQISDWLIATFGVDHRTLNINFTYSIDQKGTIQSKCSKIKDQITVNDKRSKINGSSIEHRSTNINLAFNVDQMFMKKSQWSRIKDKLLVKFQRKMSNVCKLPTNNYQLKTMLTIIILFNHSFGGLSPPKTAWV